MHSNSFVGVTDGHTAVMAEVVAEMHAIEAIIAGAQARQARVLARAGDLARQQAAGARANVRVHDMALRSIAAEIAGVLRVSDRSVQRQIGDAVELVEDYPATLDAWEAGQITRGHVRVITETGAPLPADQRAGFEVEALRRCEGQTPGRVQGELRLLAEHLHPRTLAERHAEARELRAVRVVPLGDGMSDLCVTMPSLFADAIRDRLTQQGRAIIDARTRAGVEARDRVAAARSRAGAGAGAGASFGVDPGSSAAKGVGGHIAAGARTATGRSTETGSGTGVDTDTDTDTAIAQLELIASDTRTMPQIQADLLVDMLLTADPGADPTRTDDGPGTLGAIRAKVQVVVPALTLLGRDDAPADLVGHAPIDPATARELAGTTRSPLERILTHPVTGTVLHVDTYQRTAAIDRYLRARDQHCRFPGCRLPAVRCEVDHTIDAALGGPTDVRNLAHLCQRHHSMKQFTAWKVKQLPDGVLQWTSPLGHHTLDHPPSLGVHFRPTGLAHDADSPPTDNPPDTGPDDTDPPESGMSPEPQAPF